MVVRSGSLPRSDLRPDVLVVGFGPVGSALAGLLGRRGVNVLVIDRDLDVFALPRAAHVDHTGLRVWQELGVVDQLLESMQPNGGLELVSADHRLLVRVDGGQPSISGLPSSMYFHQPLVDRTIREAVAALPSVSVHLGAELTDVDVEADRAVATITSASGDSVEIETSWIVGCDGASSAVRARMGLGLRDLGFAEDWLVVDLVLSDELAQRAPASAICHCDPLRPSYSIPMPNNRHRLEFRLMNGDERRSLVDSANLERLYPAWMTGGQATVERSAIYTFHGLVGTQWRHGRALIAGDAAHQMPPFLGQGMCSGLRDASNLAWKLQRVLDGAPDTLIDTYTSERRPHVTHIIKAAVRFGDVISVIDPELASQRDHKYLKDTRPVTERLRFALPNLKPGPLVLDGGGELFIQPSNMHGERLDDIIGQRFAVFIRTGHEHATTWWQHELDAYIADTTDWPDIDDWLNTRGATAVVVRPDRYTLWAGTDLATVSPHISPLLTGTKDGE